MAKDAKLIVSRAFPNGGGGTVYSSSVDVGARTSPKGVFPGSAEAEIAWDAVAIANTYTQTFQIQDSADDSSFANLNMSHVLTGTGSTPSVAAGSIRFRLPATVRRYVRLSITAHASAGTCNASNLYLSIVPNES